MDWSQIWPIITILLGGSSALTVGMQELSKHRSGRAAEERAENNDLKSIADRAVAMREWSDEARRIISEKASKWRRIAIEHGVPEEVLGPWPDLPSKPPTTPPTGGELL